jgi:hypothetical protein
MVMVRGYGPIPFISDWRVNDLSEERPMPTEHVNEEWGLKPYDWSKRKKRVLQNMPNVKTWVQPIGYTQAFWHQARWLANDPKREVLYLIETQNLDLAPQWAEFAANGLESGSMTASEAGLYTGDIAHGDPNHDYSLALADTFESGRKERWSRERDYQTWHTTPAQRATRFTTDDGQSAIRAHYGTQFTEEELLAMLDRPTPERPPPLTREQQTDQEWLDTLEQDATREAFRILDEEQRYYDECGVDYAGSEPCPYQELEGWLGDPLCKNGKSPIIEDDEIADWADCPRCHGTGLIQAELGTTLTTIDEDWLLE